jgi:hypothetical protein
MSARLFLITLLGALAVPGMPGTGQAEPAAAESTFCSTTY